MSTQQRQTTGTPFRAPANSLGPVSAGALARIVTAASDVALILDADGIIADVAVGAPELASLDLHHWIGSRWEDTVAADSRHKVEQLLVESHGSDARPGQRHVNQLGRTGETVPVRYSVVPFDRDERVRYLAVGRNLRDLASLQQRLVDAQQGMEREYARLRRDETRYRTLFQLATEPVLVVDAQQTRVVEANPASAEVLDIPADRLIGRALPRLFVDPDPALSDHLTRIRTATPAAAVPLVVAGSGRRVRLVASFFRQGTQASYLIRLERADGNGTARGAAGSVLTEVVQGLPEAFIVTDPDCRILETNQAFLDLLQWVGGQPITGQSLERWLGRPGVDLGILLNSLKEFGSVRNFTTIITTELGSVEEVEIAAVAVPQAELPCLGFVVRPAGQGTAAAPTGAGSADGLPYTVEQLTQLVGRVSMKDLIRETTDVIEKMCIEAALELSGDNRASAAQMLGLSRQSLYAKLRRYGLGDLDGDGA